MVTKIYSSVEFWEFVNLPENEGRLFERINGEIIEVSPANIYSSFVTANITYYLKIYEKTHKTGYVTESDGGYDITEDDTFAPDVAYISKTRQEKLPKTGFNPIPPDLAVEVISPTDLKNPKNRIQAKLEKYQKAKIPLLWMVYPDRQEVVVYEKGDQTQVMTLNDTLSGGDVLPGFELAVKDIFEE